MSILTTDADIAGLLRGARTIAVVGLSDRPNRDSNRVALYLRSHGYTIIPVNPLLTEVFGLRVYPDLESAGCAVDIVDVFRRPEFMPGIVEAAIRTGARSVWMQFDTAHNGAAADAAASGLDVVLDRCIMVEHRRLLR